MLYQKNGDQFAAEGKTFAVGGDVFANGNSAYMGLFGTVTEIRTGDDRETENDTPDIYCAFDPPEDQERTYAYERRFSALNHCPKKLDEIGLDCAIMAPETLEPIPRTLPEKTGTVYTLSYYIDSDGNCSYGILGASKDVGVLLRQMLDDLKTQEKEVVLSHVEEIAEGFSFTYEAKETGVEDLYLNYNIAFVDVWPDAKGGMAA